MDTRILLKRVKQIDQIETREKKIEDAVEALNVQKDIEKDRAAQRERQRLWILGLPRGSID